MKKHCNLSQNFAADSYLRLSSQLYDIINYSLSSSFGIFAFIDKMLKSFAFIRLLLGVDLLTTEFRSSSLSYYKTNWRYCTIKFHVVYWSQLWMLMVPSLANVNASYGRNDLLVNLNALQIDICLKELIVVVQQYRSVVVHRRESKGGNAHSTKVATVSATRAHLRPYLEIAKCRNFKSLNTFICFLQLRILTVHS